jgi:uncharacterized protein (TIGR02996 family)
MTPADAFLADICERPDDDAPRLIYADWLDDRGAHDRAELIRVQCALPTAAGPEPLRAREADLLAGHADAWRAEELPGWCRARAEFRRGFVAAVRCHGTDWLRHASDLVRRVPVEEVFFLEDDHFPAELAAGPSSLPASPHFARLRCLLLNNHHLGNRGAEALARSPHVARLRELYLDGDGIGDGGAAALASSRALAGLTSLSLRDNHIDGDGGRALAEASFAGGLTTLWLTNNRIDERGAALAAGAWRLTHLYVNHNRLGDGAAAALAQAAALAGLRELDLRHNLIGDAGARALAASPHLGGLDFLQLTGNLIGPPARRLLRQHFGERVQV